MKLPTLHILAAFWLLESVLAANNAAIRAFKRVDDVKARVAKQNAERAANHPKPEVTIKRGASAYLNSVSQKFVVDGTAIPEVAFDIGESYAGLLPISDKPDETSKLFFWFFPSSNPNATDEITIWFNGGPGCSSLSGLLTENGPFLWQPGTELPTPNSYSWTNLTNVLFVEQPIGTGFTQGTPNITNEIELGLQFVGFYKQFVDTFQAYGSKVYMTGESYAGFYVPYIADAFITANDTNYYNLAGVGINDPILGDAAIQQQIVLMPYVTYWSNVFNFNQTFMNKMQKRADECNHTSYLEKYFTFPPQSEPFPVLASHDDNPDSTDHCDMFSHLYGAALEQNPCFDIYHISQTCPHTSSVLGIVNEGDYLPPGTVNYFNRTDVKLAINAPVDANWMQCTDKNVFGRGDDEDETLEDQSPGPAIDGVLQRVIEYTNNTLIGVGNLDFILVPNGTLFALQNMTWNGLKGFQAYPQQKPFYVPYHPEYNGGRLSESGTVGHWGEERGLVFYTVELAGHMLPGYTAGAGYRMLEKLLGRIDSLADESSFSTQRGPAGGYGHVREGERGQDALQMPLSVMEGSSWLPVADL